MPSIKCRQCNLVNFSTEKNCKRCGNALNDYAPIAEQRAYQTSVEQNFQTQTYPTNVGQMNQTQAYHQPNVYQQQPSQFQSYQMPPSPAFYANQVEPPPMSCIKCAEKRGIYMQNFKKNYVPPYVFFGAFLGVLPMLILIAVLQINHQIQAPFCGVCWSKFSQTKTVETLTVLGGFFGFFIAVFFGFVANSFFVFLLLFAGIIALVVWGQVFKSKNSPKFKKVNRQEVVITDPVYGDVSFAR